MPSFLNFLNDKEQKRVRDAKAQEKNQQYVVDLPAGLLVEGGNQKIIHRQLFKLTPIVRKRIVSFEARVCSRKCKALIVELGTSLT
jgi:hypothetical protein